MPALDPAPAALRSWVGPKQFQFGFLPVGVVPDVWSCVTFFNAFFQHANDGAAPLEVRCVADSPLLQCLVLRRPDCAAQLLCALHTLHTPSLDASLEFLLHSALNHGSAALLAEALHQLAALPVFPFVLIDCLRKQERATWRRVLHSPADILFLFRRFLQAGFTRFAMAVISVLQGVDCSASEFALPPPPHDQLYVWCDPEAVRKHTWPEFHFLLEVCPQVWSKQGGGERSWGVSEGEMGEGVSEGVNETPQTVTEIVNETPQTVSESVCEMSQGVSEGVSETPHTMPTEETEEECVTHKAGLELLLMMLMRKEFDSLSDVYRFVLMEENRHAELHHSVPPQFQVDVILTQCALALLQRGHLAALLALTRAIPFQWAKQTQTHVTNFGEAVNAILNRTDLPLPPLEVFAESDLFQEMVPRCGRLREE